MTPILTRRLRSPVPLPTLVNYDGEAMVLTTVYFDVDVPNASRSRSTVCARLSATMMNRAGLVRAALRIA